MMLKNASTNNWYKNLKRKALSYSEDLHLAVMQAFQKISTQF